MFVLLKNQIAKRQLVEKEQDGEGVFLCGPEEPGRLQSMGSQRVGHHWATSLFTFFSRKSDERMMPGQTEAIGVHNTYWAWNRRVGEVFMKELALEIGSKKQRAFEYEKMGRKG